jgi:hypothetical protein
LLRWCARAGGAILFVTWLGYVIVEAARTDVGPPTVAAYLQAGALALVFAGYAWGWRNEPAGGVLALLGTAAFFAVPHLSMGYMPDLNAAWFAAPAVLYLLAWQCSRVGASPTVMQL